MCVVDLDSPCCSFSGDIYARQSLYKVEKPDVEG